MARKKIEDVFAEFGDWLVQEQGYSPYTARGYVSAMRGMHRQLGPAFADPQGIADHMMDLLHNKTFYYTVVSGAYKRFQVFSQEVKGVEMPDIPGRDEANVKAAKNVEFPEEVKAAIAGLVRSRCNRKTISHLRWLHLEPKHWPNVIEGEGNAELRDPFDPIAWIQVDAADLQTLWAWAGGEGRESAPLVPMHLGATTPSSVYWITKQVPQHYVEKLMVKRASTSDSLGGVFGFDPNED